MINRVQFVLEASSYAFDPSDYFPQEERDAVPECKGIVNIATHHPHFGAENLILEKLCLPTEKQEFELLLQNPHLQKLSLECCAWHRPFWHVAITNPRLSEARRRKQTEGDQPG